MRPKLRLAGGIHTLDILARRPDLRVAFDGDRFIVADTENGVAINGIDTPCVVARKGGTVFVRVEGRTIRVEAVDPREMAEAQSVSTDHIIAPMPGAVVSVDCTVGDAVSANDKLMTIESMKLQMSMTAPRDAVVSEIAVEPDVTFDKGQVLIRFEPDQEG